ncbi:hypothetical protein BST81_03270 [Leptolyngbya sp. 'hensonii']|uniref:AAA-like domain-containing protein n=1 Tax=Leptolyngbya sp. 'hensonii' TaxID=1922337 RepID=UPI00094FC7DC|nr:AAA-like domain-containing protein [Leptolyngbya sp. 'hensonii']OLP19875.1 hypothetical protein BST81_03270 [Leptolyngbya sp. 'hensonii']
MKSNNLDESLEVVERLLLPRQLGPIERFVLRQSWLGQTYSEMARGSGYGSGYIKEIGSQLWQQLSDAFGQRVTKKNLHLVLQQYRAYAINRSELQLGFEDDLRDSAVDNSSIPVVARLERSLSPVKEPGFPCGPLPLDSPFYIRRPPVENLLFKEIDYPGSFIRVTASRNMGKSSLLIQAIAYGRNQGYRVAYIDFQEVDKIALSSLDRCLRWFCANISRQLNLEPRLDEYWNEDIGSKVSCKTYIERYLLQQIGQPLLLVLDEVNRLLEHPLIAQDFLSMLRSWYEQAKQVPLWQKLRVVVAYSPEIHIPLHLNQSPFNVGLTLKLPPFTLEQVQALAQSYGLNWRTEAGISQAKALQGMVGGHPYLLSLAFYYLCCHEITLESLLQSAATQAGIYSPHLRQYLALLQDDPHLIATLKQVMLKDQGAYLDAISAYKLESMGLIYLDGNQARSRCQLYQLYFSQQLSGNHELNRE